jgi:hypothetical protein
MAMATIDDIRALIGIREGETFDDKLNANNAKLIDELAKLDAKLGIEDGQSLNDVLDAKLGIEEGETFDDKLNAKLETFGETFDDKLNAKLIDELDAKLDAKFDAKLGIGVGNSVNLPNMEREVHDLFSTSPDAILGSVTSNVVGMGTPQ